MVNAEDFRTRLERAFEAAAAAGAVAIEIEAGRLHREVGGYPGPDHRMPVCCNVMYGLKEEGDEVLYAPKKGKGASVRIRYVLPRKKGGSGEHHE